MKRTHHLLVIALVVAVVAFGLSYVALVVDPWTGEGDGSAGIKILTVPLALLGLPFLMGMTLAGMVMGNDGKNIAGYVIGGCIHFGFYLLITALVMRRFTDKLGRKPATPSQPETNGSGDEHSASGSGR